MSISCADLKGLRHFKQIRLVAGEKGLYRQISWPFICTTSTISQWLHGGELIFISGAGLDCGEESLLSLMRESVSKGLAGMVMLTGERYIPEIPPSLVELADASCFPLFEMPWDVKLIDVTQEISENIMYRKEQSKKGQRFLEQLLFSADDSRTFEELSGLFGIPQRAFRFIAVAEIQAGTGGRRPGHHQERPLPHPQIVRRGGGAQRPGDGISQHGRLPRARQDRTGRRRA